MNPRIESLEKMLGGPRDGALLRFSLGNEYLKAGAPDKAAGQFQAAVERDPNYSAAWKALDAHFDSAKSLTMRELFANQPKRFEEFSLAPMPFARVRQIIEGPARVAGLQVEEGLIVAATADAGTDDALPLLAFTLRELYDRHGASHQLLLAHYRELGDLAAGLNPLENSVRKRADEVIAAINPTAEELEALRDAFVGLLVRVNEKGEYVRHPARLDDLPANA